jgi:signal transduction histidine kinase
VWQQPDCETSACTALERHQRLTEEFIATVIHELRTPLGAMANWAQLLKNTPGDRDTVVRAAAAIGRAVRLQAQLVDDLLDVSRIIAGRMELATGELDLDEVIRASLEVVQHAADAKRISLRYLAAVEPLRIRADARRLQQVLVNLFTNAIKFSADEAIVSIRLGRRGAHAVIRVADSGRGISAELLPCIFERFRQAGTAPGQEGGLGLGLNIVKNLVELHGGSIEVESAGLGRGAAFTVRLPCIDGHSADLREP